MCSICKTEKVEHPVLRCMPCNITYNRVLACKKGMDGRRIAAWNNMDQAKKEAFVHSAEGLTELELKYYFEQFIPQEEQWKVVEMYDGSTTMAPKTCIISRPSKLYVVFVEE